MQGEGGGDKGRRRPRKGAAAGAIESCTAAANSSPATHDSSEFSVALRPQRPYGTIRDGESWTATLDFHTAPELLREACSFGVALRPHRDTTIRLL